MNLSAAKYTPNTLDRIEIYQATIPRDFPFPNIDAKIDASYKCLYLLGKLSVGLYWEGEYDDMATVIAVNGQYHLHPGSNRYILSRVCSEMPKLRTLIINRWGTSYETIKESFPDAELYREDFPAFLPFRDAVEPDEGRLLGHIIKPHRNVSKNSFDVAAKNSETLLTYNPKGLQVKRAGKELILLGNDRDYVSVDVDSIYDYIREVIIHFTDFEG